MDIDDHDHVTVAVHPTAFLNSDGERETFDPTERPVRYRFGARSVLVGGDGARPVDDGEVVEATTGHADEKRTVEIPQLTFPVGETGLERGDDTGWLYWERDESGEHGPSGVDTLSVYGGEAGREDLTDLLRRLLAALRGRRPNHRPAAVAPMGARRAVIIFNTSLCHTRNS